MAQIKNKKIICTKKEEIENLLSGSFGKIDGQNLILHPLEAAYLTELRLIEVVNSSMKKQNWKKILDLINDDKKQFNLNPEEQYLIYKEIRSVGRVVRFNSFDPNYWFVYSPGVGREEERAQILLNLVDIKNPMLFEDLEAKLALARQFRMEFVFGFIKNSIPSFIKLSKFSF
ncbi:MAG: hypothetical protein ACK4J0_00025 [Candidatus Anstonellaceae archaeon]